MEQIFFPPTTAPYDPHESQVTLETGLVGRDIVGISIWMTRCPALSDEGEDPSYASKKKKEGTLGALWREAMHQWTTYNNFQKKSKINAQ